MGLVGWEPEPKTSSLETERGKKLPFPCRNSGLKADLKVSSHIGKIL